MKKMIIINKYKYLMKNIYFRILLFFIFKVLNILKKIKIQSDIDNKNGKLN